MSSLITVSSRSSSKRKSKSNRVSRSVSTGKRGGLSAVPLWGKCLVLLLLTVVFLVIVGYGALRSYLKGDGFRDKLATGISKVVGGEDGSGEVNAVIWRGWDMEVDSFSLKDTKSVVRAVEAREMKMEIRVGSATEEKWDVEHVDIMKLDLEFGAADAGYKKYQAVKPTGLAGMLPYKVQLNTFEVKQMDTALKIDAGDFFFNGMRVKGEVSGSRYTLDLFDGNVELPFEELNAARHINSRLVFEGNVLSLEDADLRVVDDNPVTLDAKFDFNTGLHKITGNVQEVDITHFLDDDWSQNTRGLADIKFEYEIDEKNDDQRVSGFLAISDGILHSLPILDKVAAYTNKPGYRRLEFEKVSCQFTKHNGKTTLRDIELLDRGRLCVLGKLDVFDNGKIDGTFQVGLPRGTLSLIPGAETKVFIPGARQMHWATVRVTGTTDAIKEDLSSQLMNAAAERMGEMILEFATGGGKGTTGGGLGGVVEDLTNGKGVATGVLGIGASVLENMLGTGVAKSDTSIWVSMFGKQLELSNQWTVELKKDPIENLAFAVIEKEGKKITKLYARQVDGKAREVAKAWLKSNQLEDLKSRDFLTTEGYVSLLYSHLDKDKRSLYGMGYCRSIVFIQSEEGKVVQLRMEGGLAEELAIKIYLQKVAGSLRPERKENKGGGLIPDIGDPRKLIPFNPFGG